MNTYQRPLDITDFPLDGKNCLNFAQYGEYRKLIENMSEAERVETDKKLLKIFNKHRGVLLK